MEREREQLQARVTAEAASQGETWTGREEMIREHLDRLLASDGLVKSSANRKLLTYLVKRWQLGSESPKEAEIAIDVFGRSAAFNGAEDSAVRVAMRTLRQKLSEYYAGPGRHERLVFDVPKGSYRLTLTERGVEAPASTDGSPGITQAAPEHGGAHLFWRRIAVAAASLLVLSVSLNILLWRQPAAEDPALAQMRASALWQDMAHSERPLLFVLGDIFMYTQTDPDTGRTVTVRDPRINSSDEMRAFLAGNPELAAVRGRRYASYLQKSAATGLASIIPLVSRTGRTIEVRLREELRAEDIERNDIIYLGPFARIGPLAAALRTSSQYRFDPATSGVFDAGTGVTHGPEGELSGHYKDYAAMYRFQGAGGNQILIITAGGRNAGLAQVVRAATTADALASFDRALADADIDTTEGFEALLSVTGYKQTDLSAQVIKVRSLTGETPAAD